VDSLFSVIGVAPLLLLWRWQTRRFGAPDDLTQIATGAGLACASSLLLVVAAWLAPHGRVSFLWPFVARAGMGIAFLYYWPTLLSLVTRKAPAQVTSTLLGVVFLSLFVSNLTMGWIGSFYDRMGPVSFWSLNTAIGGMGVVLALGLQGVLRRRGAWGEG
jgi:POT family proton-dependent oligopeptide transporter